MKVANETTVWREIVNHNLEWRDSYNAKSLTDYIDTLMSYYQELATELELDKPDNWGLILVELSSLMDAQIKQFGEIGMIRVQGNGMYLPEATNELNFLDGSGGIAGEYQGLSINTLPTYQDVMYPKQAQLPLTPTLCIELSDWRLYSSSNIALEMTDASVSIPLENQDTCFSRANLE